MQISDILKKYLTPHDTRQKKQMYFDICMLPSELSQLYCYVNHHFFQEEQECRIILNDYFSYDEFIIIETKALKKN